VTLDCSTAGSPTVSARESREIDQLALRLQEAHPGVLPATLTKLVEQAFAELAQSRVQSYRLVLTERVAQLRLADLARSGQD